ncbi:MAG: DUF916 domain-containing protein [Chloroflexi bacterium]|nr:DUF916 domain-containing protein [Chloroflexota bacterium]
MLARSSALILAILTGLISLLPALAEGPDIELGIAPLDYAGQYFDITLQPGETRELKVELGNHGKDTARARTYPADVYTIVNGGFGAELDGEQPAGTTLWLDYPSKTVELEGGRALQQTFTVRVPADARPGEYITSLVVQNEKPTTSSAAGGGIAIQQVQRKVIAVAITVPGPRLPALTIGDLEHKVVAGASVIAARVNNTGNVRLRPAGEFVLRDSQGAEVTRYPIDMDTFYAGTSTTVEVPFEATLLEGGYIARLQLSDASGATAAQSAPLEVRTPKDAPPIASSGSARAATNQPRSAGTLEPDHGSVAWVPLSGAALVAVLVLVMVAQLWMRARAQQRTEESERVPLIQDPDRWRGQHGSGRGRP